MHMILQIVKSRIVQAVYVIIAASIYVISANTGFIYFDDSRFYRTADESMPYSLMIISGIPLLTAAIGGVLGYVYYRAISVCGFAGLFVFLNPYFLLLSFNMTKEQLLFAGTCGLVFARNKKNIFSRVIMLFSLVIIADVRPVYLPLALLLISPKIYNKTIRATGILALLLMVLYVVLSGQEDFLLYIYNILTDRSVVEHTGRDFFNYLCVHEKSDIGTFLPCWLSTYFGFPPLLGESAINYIFYGLYAAGVHLIIIEIYIHNKMSGIIAALIMISYSIFILWWSPTFGAYLRYYYPVVFMMLQSYSRRSKVH